MNSKEISEVLTAANSAAFVAGRPSGCGRAYVVLTDNKDIIRSVAACCKSLGLMFLKSAYGTTGNAIYIGYDNADGKAIAKSEAFAAVLNERGIHCYADAVGD